MQFAISPHKSEAYQLGCICIMEFRIFNVTLPITKYSCQIYNKNIFHRDDRNLKVQSKSQHFLQFDGFYVFVVVSFMFYGEVIVQRGDLKNKILISM